MFNLVCLFSLLLCICAKANHIHSFSHCWCFICSRFPVILCCLSSQYLVSPRLSGMTSMKWNLFVHRFRATVTCMQRSPSYHPLCRPILPSLRLQWMACQVLCPSPAICHLKFKETEICHGLQYKDPLHVARKVLQLCFSAGSF